MTSTNKLILDLSEDEDLRDYLADKSVGDECRLELLVSLDENTGGQAVFSVVSTEAEDSGDDSPKEEDAEYKADKEEDGEDAPASIDGTARPKGPAAVLAIFKKKKS